MVLAPLTTPAHFTGRRSGPPVKGQAAPPSPTAAASPRSRLRAWRGRSFSEDATPSPGAIHRSIFSLDPKELAAMFLEAPAQQPKEIEDDAGPQEQGEGVLPGLEHSWDQEALASGSPVEENRYVVVNDPEAGGNAKGEAIARVAQELVEGAGAGKRHRIRLAAIGMTAGAGLLSLILLCTAAPKPAALR